MAQKRQPAGAPASTGGRYAPAQRATADADLSAPQSEPGYWQERVEAMAARRDSVNRPSADGAEARRVLQTVEGYVNNALDDGDGFAGEARVSQTDAGIAVRVVFSESTPQDERHYWLDQVAGELQIAKSVGRIPDSVRLEE